MPATRQATLMDHVVELRWRLVKIAAVFFVGAGIGYGVRGPIIGLLQKPLGEQLYFTSPTGSFEFIMQVCALVGIVLALPVLIYQLLRFVEPALNRPLSRKLVIGVVASSYTLAAGGVAFAYLAGLPMALHFFTSVGTDQLHPLITINEYFKFVMSYLITFAVAFQLPLLLLLINHITPMGPTKLRKWRKYVIVGSFGLALLTPTAPDPVSQAVLALPVIILYEFSLILVAFQHRKTTRLAARQEAAQAPVQAQQTSQQAAAQPQPVPRPRPPRQPRPQPVLQARHQPPLRPQPAPQLKPRPAGGGAGPIDLRAWAPPAPQLSYHTIDLRPQA